MQNAGSRPALPLLDYSGEFWQRREALLLTGRIAVRWMVRKADMPTQELSRNHCRREGHRQEYYKDMNRRQFTELAAAAAAFPELARARAALAPLDRGKYRPQSHAPVLPAQPV